MTATLERTATITVDSAALKLATAWAARALPRRPPHPALTGMLLTTAESALTVTAWDWNTLCSATVDIVDGDLGTVLVNGSLLADITSRLTGTSSLDLDSSELLARSGSGRAKYRLRLMPAEEYPHYRPAPPAVGAATKLGEAITRVAYAAAKEPPAGTNLDAVSAQARDGVLRLFCTDRYRMASTSTPWTGPDIDFAVDARRLAELSAHLGGWDVQIGIDPDRIALHAGGRTAVLSQVGGDYVTVDKARSFYERPWTQGHVDLDRVDLLTALDDASPTVEREQHVGGTVRLEFTEGEVTVSSTAAELGASDSVAGCRLDGDPRAEMFVGDYLQQALKAIPGDTVRISFGKPNGAPTLFSPLAGDEIDLGQSHIVMSKKF